METIKLFMDKWESQSLEYFNHYIKEYIKPGVKYSDIKSKMSKADFTIFESLFVYGKREDGIEYANKRIKSIINKERINKEQQLLTRIEKALGSIIDAKGLRIAGNGEINGVVIGEEGKKVRIETITAGGYHIQRLHYRVLIKKVK